MSASRVSSSAIGIGCLPVFAVSQGARDAFFGNVFQATSFFFVAALGFATSTLWRRPQDPRVLFAAPASFVALNVATAAAWLSFFFGLKYLEPAVAGTIYNGIGPLAVLVLGRLGWVRSQEKPCAGERLCYAGLAITLAALALVVLADRSGVSISSFATQTGALVAVAVGG